MAEQFISPLFEESAVEHSTPSDRWLEFLFGMFLCINLVFRIYVAIQIKYLVNH
jgi:hypothetical protein